LRTLMVRAGLPTQQESHDLLAADRARDELNEATGKETERLILQQRFVSHEQARDFPRTAKEQAAWDREAAEIRHEAHVEFGPDAILDFERALKETRQ